MNHAYNIPKAGGVSSMLPACCRLRFSPDAINYFDKLMFGRMELFHSVHRDGVPVTSPCPGRWLVWWVWRNIMYRLLQERPPLGFDLPASLRWPFSLPLFFFFFCLLPVARSSHHLTVSCQFSCSAASSLWCTGSNLMFFSRGGWGGVGSLPRYWRSFLCWTYLWPDFYLFSVTFIHISFHLKIFLFFGLFLHLKGLFFGSNMLKVACFCEGDFRPSLLASLVWHTWEIDNTP